MIIRILTYIPILSLDMGLWRTIFNIQPVKHLPHSMHLQPIIAVHDRLTTMTAKVSTWPWPRLKDETFRKSLAVVDLTAAIRNSIGRLATVAMVTAVMTNKKPKHQSCPPTPVTTATHHHCSAKRWPAQATAVAAAVASSVTPISIRVTWHSRQWRHQRWQLQGIVV